MSKELTDHNYWISKLHKYGKTLGYDTVREIAEMIADECWNEYHETAIQLMGKIDEIEAERDALLNQINAVRKNCEDTLENLSYFRGK